MAMDCRRRVRVGDYRIAYLVDDVEGMVGIIAAGHRSRFYDDRGCSGV